MLYETMPTKRKVDRRNTKNCHVNFTQKIPLSLQTAPIPFIGKQSPPEQCVATGSMSL